MGLDMFAYAAESLAVEAAGITTLTTKPGERSPLEEQPDALQELAYWRKHPDLHGWMQQHWAAETGIEDPERFNCVNLELSAERLELLASDILGGTLPQTQGFFFGRSEGNREEREEDMAFVMKAREAIAAGKRVFYSSWW